MSLFLFKLTLCSYIVESYYFELLIIRKLIRDTIRQDKLMDYTTLFTDFVL